MTARAAERGASRSWPTCGCCAGSTAACWCCRPPPGTGTSRPRSRSGTPRASSRSTYSVVTSTMTDRFKPSRAGVINIWDYVDEEWAFADGRLALRGHNGSGKTKALEVLFPFVLDGVADSRRLDPFSGENRTMKSNLLFRGQESEYGYVWMEFARAQANPLKEPARSRRGQRRDRDADHRHAGAPELRRRADVVLRHRHARRRGLRPAVGGLPPADRTPAPRGPRARGLAADRDRVPRPGRSTASSASAGSATPSSSTCCWRCAARCWPRTWTRPRSRTR